MAAGSQNSKKYPNTCGRERLKRSKCAGCVRCEASGVLKVRPESYTTQTSGRMSMRGQGPLCT
eukprot:1644741-Pleurochrysis_carterae.AAC.1